MIHAFPPFPGGTSHVVDMLSKNLVSLGHTVEVVTLDTSGGLEKSDCLAGVSVRRFRGLAPKNCYFFPSPHVISYLKSVKADIIHAHSLNALLVPACWFAVRKRMEKTPFVLSPHHHPAGSVWHTRLFWKPYTPLAGYIVRSASKLHCVSEYEARLVKEHFGSDSVVIQNGVAQDTFRYKWNPPSDGLVLTYAGRLERYKRVHVLIEAASILLKKKKKVTVRIIGEGPELSRLTALANNLGVAVEHFHFLKRPEYLGLLSTSSFFVNPSQFEAFSIVVAEAKTIGVPVVASSPWGETFQDLPDVSIVDGNSPKQIADVVSKPVNQKHKNTPSFMTWKEVAKQLVQQVYLPSLKELRSRNVS